ncbi:DUF4433 domain-containing protein [Rheinheimera riviphila]|uniref:DUF4433 domain-containing protein n=1 Tax=Rheinheimera riviphila TaxID=1834037 RepID=A0A437QIX6_9GAMM|nr:DUF4433 domain-containing protein [Rheinheimera riviphila]RVU34489.1 DUF4433 domain-containing protein [Rheinheimera riviphila]
MAYNYSGTLNPERGLIWRIVHRDNIPWILDNGLHCGSSTVKSGQWVSIGNSELIGKRANHPVPVPPYGCLNDYVPFYFTPFSPMLLNILSGRGVPQRSNKEIVILVSSVERIQHLTLDYAYTDMHAYYQWATFYKDPAQLSQIDWSILQTRDFSRNMNDPAKFERYQAEFLVHQHCPVQALQGMVCYDEVVQQQLNGWLQQRQLLMDVRVRPGWYF